MTKFGLCLVNREFWEPSAVFVFIRMECHYLRCCRDMHSSSWHALKGLLCACVYVCSTLKKEMCVSLCAVLILELCLVFLSEAILEYRGDTLPSL